MKNVLGSIPAHRWRGVVPKFTLGGRFEARLSCARCGTDDTWTAAKMPDPSIVIGKFRDRGWTSIKGQHVCPACVDKDREARAMAGQQQVAEKAAASVNATKAKLQAAALLESEFDAAAGRYRDGCGDKAIGDTVGLSEQAIADLRATFGLVIRERPEVAALRKDIEAFGGRLRALKGEIDALDTLVRNEIARGGELAKRLEALAG